ncbi:MAG: glycine cleavage system protein T, partial [Pseudomonadota bacterium]|nr:glycine cleavage system protein T [Pseudomonadota bacterium]
AFRGGIADLKYFWTTTTDFQDAEIVISRAGYSGEFGYEVYLADAIKSDASFEHLLAAGKPFNVAPGCVSRACRIEFAILFWGVDMTADENPFEVGLGRLVNLTGAAPYIGQRALRRIAATSPR